MAATIIGTTIAGTIAQPTGLAFQGHLQWAVNDAAWWFFYLNSGTNNVIHCQRSPDGTTWTAKTDSGTFPALGSATDNWADGRNLGVCYKNISSNDVFHIDVGVSRSTNRGNAGNIHYRATAASAAITWAAGAQVGSTTSGTAAAANPQGSTPCIDSNNVPVSNLEFDTTATSDGGVARGSNADTGSAWTPGFGAVTVIRSATTNSVNASAVFDIGGGNLLTVQEDADSTEPSSMKTYYSSKYTGTWAAPITVFTALAAAVDPNNAGFCAVGTATVHAVQRTGTNTYVHKKYATSGTTWGAGDSIPTQNSTAGTGIALVTDGTNLWMGIIDSDAADTVRYIKWTSGVGWDASWTALETATAVRTYITAAMKGDNSAILWGWTQTNGSNFDVAVELLSLTSSALSIAVSDSTTPAEATDLASNPIRIGVSDASLVPTDTVTMMVSRMVAVSDTVTTPAEVVTVLLALPSSAADTTTPAESFTVFISIAPAISDTTTPTDSISIVLSAWTMAIADTTTPAEVVAVRLPESAAITDTTTPAEVVVLFISIAPAVSDSTAPTDAVTIFISIAPAVSDPTSVSAEAVTVTFGLDLSMSVSDATTATDIPKLFLSYSPAVSDPTSVSSDVPRIFLSYAPAVSDPASISAEVLAITFGTDLTTSVSDTTTATDIPTVRMILPAAGTDTLSVADIPIVSLPLSAVASDASTPSENVSLTFGTTGVLSPAITDSPTPSETLNLAFNVWDIAVADTTGPADVPNVRLPLAASPFDITLPTDVVTVTLPLSIGVLDPETVSDSVLVTLGGIIVAATIVEIVTVSENALARMILPGTAIDAATPAESILVRTALKGKLAPIGWTEPVR